MSSSLDIFWRYMPPQNLDLVPAEDLSVDLGQIESRLDHARQSSDIPGRVCQTKLFGHCLMLYLCPPIRECRQSVPINSHRSVPPSRQHSALVHCAYLPEMT